MFFANSDGSRPVDLVSYQGASVLMELTFHGKRSWNLPFLFWTVILEWNASVMLREVITFPIAPWERISPSANINALSKQGKISST